MARCGFLSLPRVMLLLVVFIGDVVAMAMARTLLGGIAQTPLPAEAPGVGARPSGRRQDRSIAGADVILIGFAAAVVAVIFLYIRVTRKSNHGANETTEKA
ncbi:unnamed protein product [Alopecurus aequalis]